MISAELDGYVEQCEFVCCVINLLRHGLMPLLVVGGEKLSRSQSLLSRKMKKKKQQQKLDFSLGV